MEETNGIVVGMSQKTNKNQPCGWSAYIPAIKYGVLRRYLIKSEKNQHVFGNFFHFPGITIIYFLYLWIIFSGLSQRGIE